MAEQKSKYKRFDDILTVAFREQMKAELDALPSKEELDALYPVQPHRRAYIEKLANKYNKTPFIVYLRRVSVILLVLISVSFGYVMTNSELRAGMLEKGLSVFDEYIRIDFGWDKSNYKVDIDTVEISYIPEGYELIYETVLPDYFSQTYSNHNNDNFIGIDITNEDPNSEDSHNITNQFTVFDKIKINGFDGYTSYYEEENCSLIIWGNDNFTIYLTGIMTVDELMEIALNIKYELITL